MRTCATGRVAVLLLAFGGGAFCSATPALSEVRFGGHDFSNRTYDRKNRAVIHLYDRPPRRAGCAWRADGRGGQVKVCHLQRIRRH